MRQLKITQSITKRNESTQKYLNSVAALSMLTPDEELHYAVLAKEGKDERTRIAARNRLVTANLRFAISVAKQYQTSGALLDDLIEEANIGLITAANNFDHTKGFKFISYAVWWIRQGLTQYISEHTHSIRMPQNKVALLTKVNNAASKFIAEHGFPPSEEDIAEICDLPIKDVVKVMTDSLCQNEKSLSSTIGDDDSTLDELIADTSIRSTDDGFVASDLETEIREAFKILSEREQLVLIDSCGLFGHEQRDLETIGHSIGLTRERVRQIQAAAKKKLKNKCPQLKFLLG